MLLLRSEFSKTVFKYDFKRPTFRIIVLHCDMETSVERQIKRGLKAKKKFEMEQQIGFQNGDNTIRQTDFEYCFF
jgi:dephospho-CoA kinase